MKDINIIPQDVVDDPPIGLMNHFIMCTNERDDYQVSSKKLAIRTLFQQKCKSKFTKIWSLFWTSTCHSSWIVDNKTEQDKKLLQKQGAISVKKSQQKHNSNHTS